MTQEQLDHLLVTATTNEPSVVVQEIQRATSVSPHLGPEGQAQWGSELEEEFLGSWVAVEGDTDWISWLEFRREQIGPVATNVYLFANVDSSATTEWSGYALKFIPSIYSDSLTAVPETNYDPATGQLLGQTGYSLTYTARMTHENKIVVRIAVFSNGALWAPFYERKVVLAKPTGYQLLLRFHNRK